jgi:carbamoylphosphate synthase large subunit
MHVIFVEPSFPANQARFVRGLHEVGARVVGIGERPKDALDDGTAERLVHYEQVDSVVDEGALAHAVRRVQGWVRVERLDATVEAHVLAAAHVREACGIPGTTSRTAYLCRDKPAMKEVLREAGVPCARSMGGGDAEALRAFASEVGYPLVVKPRSGAGAAGATRVNDAGELDAALERAGVGRGGDVAIEEYLEGHEGFYDTLSVEGRVAYDFVAHYYPNVLEAMRTRWISPQLVTTNRIDTAPDYERVRELGRRVNEVVGIWTSATHMEWFFGPGGLRFSEIGCRPPGVGTWDLYSAANEVDLYREWAMAVCHGRVSERPSRRYAAGIIALRPDRDGVIDRYEGVEEIQRAFGEWILDAHLPPPGTPTQPIDAGYMANAWVRMRHPDYDEVRRMLGTVGETLKVRAR